MSPENRIAAVVIAAAVSGAFGASVAEGLVDRLARPSVSQSDDAGKEIIEDVAGAMIGLVAGKVVAVATEKKRS